MRTRTTSPMTQHLHPGTGVVVPACVQLTCRPGRTVSNLTMPTTENFSVVSRYFTGWQAQEVASR
jgi:hypothetical protein